MRHLRTVNHLGRKSAHRKAMLSNMAASLIMNKRIATTEAKAKALRTYVEPLLTRSKEDSTHSRRVVFSYLQNKIAVAELFREVSPKIADRPGGYTRILKTGPRFGDNADMCIIELVDFNENMLTTDDSKSKTSKRRRGTKKKTEPEAKIEKAVKPVAAEEAKVIEAVEEAEVVEAVDEETAVAENEVSDASGSVEESGDAEESEEAEKKE
jgi:large subunit ribosomal protein L17